MKKIISLLLVLTMALCLAACGSETNNESPKESLPAETAGSSTNVQETEAGAQETEAPAVAAEGFVFSYNGIEIPMNVNAADILAQLGEPVSYTEEASCAFEGLDKTFYFGSFYLQTYPMGEEDFVYGLWLVDDSVTTDEGIYIGASQAEVENAYGADSYNGTNAYILTEGESKLTVILKDGAVSSIQYDAIVE